MGSQGTELLIDVSVYRYNLDVSVLPTVSACSPLQHQPQSFTSASPQWPASSCFSANLQSNSAIFASPPVTTVSEEHTNMMIMSLQYAQYVLLIVNFHWSLPDENSCMYNRSLIQQTFFEQIQGVRRWMQK